VRFGSLSPRGAATVVGAVALGSVSCGGTFGMPRGATEQGAEIFDLWRVFFVAAIVVAAIVYGLIGWAILRYRRRRSEPPDVRGADFREHRTLEVVYVAIPLAIVAALFTLTLQVDGRVTDVAADPDVRVHVEAFAWGWRFSYPDEGVTVVSDPSAPGVAGPELVLPVGETTQIVLTSNDVIHAFWVPGFLFKRDAIPGVTQVFDLTPIAVGTYHGACAEFCGLNHAYMTFAVHVVPEDEFASWLAERAGVSAEPTGS
jgi:cytochrome c oxidase subunit II